jgi:hypothetical protein
MEEESEKLLWLNALRQFDYINHIIKSGSWFEEDQRSFYKLKDEFLSKLYYKASKEKSLSIRLLYVPYFLYSSDTKKRAGQLMLQDQDKDRKPFDYYLDMVESSSNDIELPSRASIEMEVTLDKEVFVFHIPQQKTIDWGIDINKLGRKKWISGREYHRMQYLTIKKQLRGLLDRL